MHGRKMSEIDGDFKFLNLRNQILENLKIWKFKSCNINARECSSFIRPCVNYLIQIYTVDTIKSWYLRKSKD